jgi:signal transduction histidine kinase
MLITDFADLISTRIRAEHETLAARWFDRLCDLVPVDARKVFPTNSLLDHVPALILEIAGSVRDDATGALAANTAILEKARELGALRHGQQASLHQVLREYQILGGVLVQFVLDEIGALEASAPAAECVRAVGRIHQAVDVLQQTTVETFVTLYTSTIADQPDRLQQFTKGPLGLPGACLQPVVGQLRQATADGHTAKTLELLDRNVSHLVDLTRKLEAVARLQGTPDTAVTQTVMLGTVAREAVRQLRDMADMRDVELRIDDSLPELTVDVGRLELTIVNLLSNAIKYSDPAKPQRSVEISGGPAADGWCCLQVRDNGVGIPADALGSIFGRFTRAHNGGGLHVDGVGLGLSIVDDCVHAMHGRVEVASVEGEGTSFKVFLPLHPIG